VGAVGIGVTLYDGDEAGSEIRHGRGSAVDRDRCTRDVVLDAVDENAAETRDRTGGRDPIAGDDGITRPFDASLQTTATLNASGNHQRSHAKRRHG
jgi:hypothetical protein